MRGTLQFMRTQAPVLAPFFRSEGQARLLAELMLNGDEVGVAELADRVGLAYPSVYREVNRLVEAGVLRERHLGRRRLISANPESPLTNPVREILMVVAGPVPLLRRELEQIPGVGCAFLFGSFASRVHGLRGPAPSDIDLMVVGGPAPGLVYSACRRVSEQVGRTVNPTILTAQEWRAESGFLAEVRDNAVVQILGDVECL